ncbi:Fe2+-dependent dioxygenase [Shimia aestuarii]|uniref:PKHD-type hydroxylase n=1 Tax=Shimia aestuarii TaxID=254406 RepID=A0A1I4HFM1_9RHOB|nr:Fe2+-dependent dioxygenase [Shimia aestuarii]SFL40176.1 PKHD-type hydroxylase [Shimia aestuarii]
MPIVLSDLLTPSAAEVLSAAAAQLPFEDGARTAGSVARAVKDNEQAANVPETRAVTEKIQATLLSHPGFQAVAYPRQFARLIVSRTSGGGQYGDHVDNALIAGQRADVSFTLFLSDPDTYDGGELVIGDRIEDRQFKLDRGEAIVYPSNTLHRVNPVTRGARIVVIGWVTSWVRDPAQREILFDLWRAINTTDDPAQQQLLSKSRSNLIRMWAG